MENNLCGDIDDYCGGIGDYCGDNNGVTCGDNCGDIDDNCRHIMMIIVTW